MTEPTIVVNERPLVDVLDDAWRAVQAAHSLPRVFLRDGRLAWLAEGRDGIRLEWLDRPKLMAKLVRSGRWVRRTKRGAIPTHPLDALPGLMLKSRAADLPLLEEVVVVPMFGKDGTLLQAPGYHAADRLWYEPLKGFELPPVPETPSTAELSAAKDLLLGQLLRDVPFVADSDRAHAVTGFVLPFVRRMIDGYTPIHLIEAAHVEAYLAALASIVAMGRACAEVPLPRARRRHRRFINQFVHDEPVVFLETMGAMPDPVELASRTLAGGRSAPDRTTWFVASKYPKQSATAAGYVRVRLDDISVRLGREPSSRLLRVKEWAEEHRAELIHAILVLVRSWLAAGRPSGERSLSSFESWAAVMGGILQNAGIPGFLDSVDD
jgi:putative DNA primase/helicase